MHEISLVLKYVDLVKKDETKTRVEKESILAIILEACVGGGSKELLLEHNEPKEKRKDEIKDKKAGGNPLKNLKRFYPTCEDGEESFEYQIQEKARAFQKFSKIGTSHIKNSEINWSQCDGKNTHFVPVIRQFNA